MEKLDVTSFEKALSSLISILERYRRENDVDLRDAVIQRFEYTYSICLKMITRYININSSEEKSAMTFNEIIRTANQFFLLKSNLEVWSNFRLKRNMTSHTYDEEIANQVLAIIPEFIEEMKYVLEKLKN